MNINHTLPTHILEYQYVYIVGTSTRDLSAHHAPYAPYAQDISSVPG
jgi:hypothetical protein